MEKLIQANRDVLIKCDTHNCDYVILNTNKDINTDLKPYINKPCPKCSANLLSHEDYLLDKKLINVINVINKWFSWLTIFRFKKNKSKNYKQKIKVFNNEITTENI